jgi:hypothetical protein
MLTLHNLRTGESRFIREAVMPHCDEILLTSEESLTDLLDLRAAWEKDFPGDSQAMVTLRNDLIRADWLRRRARTILGQLQLDLSLTRLPMHYWDRQVQQQVRFFEKHAAHTQNEFRKALQLLQSQKPAQSKPEAAPGPPKPERDYRPDIPQTVEVRIIEGKTITTTDLQREDFLETDLLKVAGNIWRNFCFHDGIPAEYAWTTQHEGIEYGPSSYIQISYTPEEFKEICLRELAAGSEHVLDGMRCGYSHREN